LSYAKQPLVDTLARDFEKEDIDPLAEAHRNDLVCRLRSILHGPFSQVFMCTNEIGGPAMTMMNSTSGNAQTRDPNRFVGHVATKLSEAMFAVDSAAPRYPVDRPWYIYFIHHAHIYAAMRYKHSLIVNRPFGTPSLTINHYRTASMLEGKMRMSAGMVREAIEMCERDDPKDLEPVKQMLYILFQGYDDHPKYYDKEVAEMEEKMKKM
jgi:hypothetical protein